jgi:transposase
MSSPEITLFIGAFIDGLDVAAAGFKRVKPKMTGRPGYAPGDLLKFSIYGYLNRVRSSRRLAAECPATSRSLDVIWEWMSGWDFADALNSGAKISRIVRVLSSGTRKPRRWPRRWSFLINFWYWI